MTVRFLILVACVTWVSFGAYAEGPTDKALTVENCNSSFFERLTVKLAAQSIKARVLNDGFASATVRTKIRRVKGSSPARVTYPVSQFAPGFGEQAGNNPNSHHLYGYSLSEKNEYAKTARAQFNINEPVTISPALSCSNAIVITATVRASYKQTDSRGKTRRKSATGTITSPVVEVKGFYTKVRVGA